MVNPLLAPELREMLEHENHAELKRFLEETPSAGVAEYLGALKPEEIACILSLLNIKFQADVFSHLELPLQVDLVKDQGRKQMARLLEEMSPDDRADLMQALPEQVQEELLPLVAHAQRLDIRRLVSYPDETVGAVMTTDYAWITDDITVAEALKHLRQEAPDKETIYYVYVTDSERHLKGVVSLKTLILAKPDRRVSDLMITDVVRVRATDDQETVAREVAKYDWLAMPVVDEQGRLVGIVTVDDVIDVLEEEAEEDAYAFGAAGKPVDYFQASVLRMAVQRLPWLLALVVVGFVSAWVIGLYRVELGEVTALAVLAFSTMLTGSGGNASTQTTTVIVRGLATGEITTSDALRILRKELTVALIVGVILAVLAGGRVMLTHHEWHLAFTVGAAMLATVVIAKGLGSMLPLILQRTGLDPAIMSAPLITTILDVVTLTVYLLLATVIMSGIRFA